MPARRKVVSHRMRIQRNILASNVERLIAERYAGKSFTAAAAEIQQATGISLSSLQRITSRGTGPSIDTLVELAYHLGSSVIDLLTEEKKRESVLPVSRNAIGAPTDGQPLPSRRSPVAKAV